MNIETWKLPPCTDLPSFWSGKPNRRESSGLLTFNEHKITINMFSCYLPSTTTQMMKTCLTTLSPPTTSNVPSNVRTGTLTMQCIISSVRSSNSYPDLLVTQHHQTWQDSGILWHTLAYSGILCHTLAYSCILWHTLAYSGILWHTLAYSGILWHTLAYSGILWHTLAYSCILWHTLAYSGIIWHTLA